MEAAVPTKRMRRSKWDVKAADVPNVSALQAAQSAVARALPSQLSAGVPATGLPATQQQPNLKSQLHPVAPEATVGLCDCSASARRRLVARATHDEITAKTGAAVTTKGRYFPPAEAERAGTEALHLHLTGESQEQVDAAVVMVNAMLQPQQQTVVQSWSAPAAPTLKGFSHFLAVGIQPDASCGFDLSAKLSGPQGSFLMHIGREGRCVVSLRGGHSPHDPLGIFIDQAPSHEALRHAVGLADSLVATVRTEYASWIRTQQPLIGSMPLAAPPTLQCASVETYLGPSYATFQSAVKSSQQQAAPSFATRGAAEHVNTILSASDSDGVPAGSAAASTAAPSAFPDGGLRAKQQQQRSFAAIGFNYNSTNNAGTTSSVVAPMPMALPAALKRPRSPSKPAQSNHHRAFQELAATSAGQNHDGDNSSGAASTSAASTSTSTSISTSTSASTSTSTSTATSTTVSDTAQLGAIGAPQVAKRGQKAFWMA